jgi:N-acetylglutamate synthase
MIQLIEELSLNAWPSLQAVLLDGWVLRFANGYTRRANSVVPLYPARRDPLEKVILCEGFYRERGLPVIFKLAGRAQATALDGLLAAHGYRAEADTSVQCADLRHLEHAVSGDVYLSSQANPAWEDAFHQMSGLSNQQQAVHSQLLRAIVPAACFASILVDGQVQGCGLGVLQDGYLGIFDVLVRLDQRRKGYGRRIMGSLLSWGKQQGAHTAYLQVMCNNPPALNLYAGLGFQEVYQYWYRVKD